MLSIQSNGIRISFEVTGTGPAVVLNHSLLCSGAMWREQVAPLAAEYRVINIDARGHGASGPIPQRFTLDDLVDDVLAVLDHLGVQSAVWGGLSIGGMVALRAALRAPDRVSALILVDTDAGSENFFNRVKFRALASIVRTVGTRPVLTQIEKQMFGRTTRRMNRALVEEWRERFTQMDVPSAVLAVDALVRRGDLHERLKEIQVPALVLVGTEDESLPPVRSRRIAQALPHARLVEIPGAGHLSSLEQPAAVTKEMLAFLRSS